jgi:hypothetical protein
VSHDASPTAPGQPLGAGRSPVWDALAGTLRRFWDLGLVLLVVLALPLLLVLGAPVVLLALVAVMTVQRLGRSGWQRKR